MKTSFGNKLCPGFLAMALIVAALGLAGCADEYVAYPGYRGGYYASYSAPYPYYGGYGYPYRAYGPYYGTPYGYGAPYYGSSVVISGSRGYAYRDRFGRVHRRRNVNRAERTSRISNRTETRVRTRATSNPQYQNDDERRYYTPR